MINRSQSRLIARERRNLALRNSKPAPKPVRAQTQDLRPKH